MSHQHDSDEDSFNEPDESGHMSDDSFNDDPPEQHQADDEDNQFDDQPHPSSSGMNSTTASSSSTSSVATPMQTTRTSLAFQIEGKQGDYVILSDVELRSSMEALTQDVASVLHVPSYLASMLLRTHAWNKEKFVTQYFEDPDRLLVKNGLQFMAKDGATGNCKQLTTHAYDDSTMKSLPTAMQMDRSKTAPPIATPETSISQSRSSTTSISSTNSSSDNSPPQPKAVDATFNCPVCYDDYPLDATVALGCGHRFCHNCWSSYLTTAVNDGKLCIISRCAAFKCPILVPDKTFQHLTAPDVFHRHQQYLVRSFVEDNRLMRWCPAQRCDYAVKMLNSSVSAVKCRCGYAFCFRCGEENHAPVGCEQLAEWLQKCKNESETAHWIIANTKKCPKCAIRIEKNQGCNHMTCRGCKFEWCWVCHGDWQLHGNHTGGYYKCNKWDPKEAKPADKGSAEEAKAELNRYLHYYQRYHNHDQSKRFAEKQKIQTEKRMASLHAQSGGDAAWIDFQFLASATQQVLECRNVLKYTYVFAYYLEDGPEKTLFEFLQQQLEASNEHLSELSELPPLEKIDRAAIVNYTRITNQFMNNLLNGVASGLTPH